MNAVVCTFGCKSLSYQDSDRESQVLDQDQVLWIGMWTVSRRLETNTLSLCKSKPGWLTDSFPQCGWGSGMSNWANWVTRWVTGWMGQWVINAYSNDFYCQAISQQVQLIRSWNSVCISTVWFTISCTVTWALRAPAALLGWFWMTDVKTDWLM